MSVDPSAQYKIGIVILAYNRLDITLKCLESLRKIKYKNYDILIVDNHSTDGTADRIPSDFPEAHFITLNENAGFTGGNNIGIRWYLERDIDAILLLNNDTLVQSDFLCRMTPHLKDQMIVTPQILSLKSPDLFGACMGEFDWNRGNWEDDSYGKLAVSAGASAREVGMSSACCLLIPRRVFEKIGVFDDNYFLYYEDVDFIGRAKLAGFSLLYEPKAIIYHYGRASTDQRVISPVALYYGVRNRLFIIRKFKKGNLKHIFFFTYVILSELGKSVYWGITCKWDLVLAEYRGIRDFLLKRMNRVGYQW